MGQSFYPAIFFNFLKHPTYPQHFLGRFVEQTKNFRKSSARILLCMMFRYDLTGKTQTIYMRCPMLLAKKYQKLVSELQM